MAQTIFDPRVHSEIESDAPTGTVWTSQSVQWALDAIRVGQKLKASPFFEKNPDLRKGNLVFQYSDAEILEVIKCSKDIMYFIEKYCKIKRPDGKIGNFRLRPYQLKQIKDYIDNDEIILGWSRQSGKTIGTSLYIIWAMLFNADKHAALLANKSSTSGEVLSKIKSIYKELPFFLKAGIIGYNGSTVVFDNGCRMYTGPTTIDALNGKTCNILYIDEFAFVGKGRNKVEYQKDFLANAKPVLSSQKESGLCKLIISSTPYGKEHFFTLFNDAIKGKNRMRASKVCWWEIPGKTLKWAQDEISSIGLSKFKQQYEMSFDVHAETLLAAKTMRRLMKQKTDYVSDQFDILSNYEEFLYVHPEVEIDPDVDVFCLTVDIAEGLGQDYSTIQILRVGFNEKTSKFLYEQIGFFACNTLEISEFALVARELFAALNPDYSKLLVEQNTYGEYFFKCLQDETTSTIEVPFESIVKFKRNSDSNKKIKGLRTNVEVKKVGVKSFKTLLDNQDMIIHDATTIEEIENFQRNSKGNYAASIGHDDKVMPLVNFSYWAQLNEPEFQFWLEEYVALNEIQYRHPSDIENEDMSGLSEEVKQMLKSV